MPELEPGEHLQIVWHKAGECTHGDMVTPLKWQELMAYSTMTGTILTHEDWSIVMEMSVAYCAAMYDRNALSISPVERLANE